MSRQEKQFAKRMPRTYEHIERSEWVFVGMSPGSSHIVLEHPEAGKVQVPNSSSDQVRCDLNTRTRLRRREAESADERWAG